MEVQAECGLFGQVEEVRALMKMLMDEILAVAKAEGVDLTEQDRDEIIEIAGEVVKLGKKHGIPTPANEILYLAITARQKIAELRKG